MECEKNMDKNKWLFDRDEHGELLPKKVFVKALNEDILLTPLTWGEWKRIRTNLALRAVGGKFETSQEEDIDVILNHCKQPAFNIEEARLLKPFVVDAITNTIYEHSALKSEETNVEQVGDVPK